jgi:NADH dehydrogenase FAD-containing subunit
VADREARGGTLIVGGGFAGAYVARLLKKRGATIVSPENFMLYTPMLPEAASGTLEPRHGASPGETAREEPPRRAEALPLPHARPGRDTGPLQGIAEVLGLGITGFLGWFVTRTYHLYQLPLFSRKLRVVVDWTVALFFRRDIAELGTLGHPQRLGDE